MLVATLVGHAVDLHYVSTETFLVAESPLDFTQSPRAGSFLTHTMIHMRMEPR
jgi:hypothetical protein